MLKTNWEQARASLQKLINGQQTLSITAGPSTDDDRVIASALDRGEKCEAALRRLLDSKVVQLAPFANYSEAISDARDLFHDADAGNMTFPFGDAPFDPQLPVPAEHVWPELWTNSKEEQELHILYPDGRLEFWNYIMGVWRNWGSGVGDHRSPVSHLRFICELKPEGA